MSVQIELDPTVDAAYVSVTEHDVEYTTVLDQRRRVDYDEKGEPVGFEFLDVAQGVDLQGLPPHLRPELERLLAEHHIPMYA